MFCACSNGVTASAAVESKKRAATMSAGLVCISTPVKDTTYCTIVMSVKLEQDETLRKVKQQVKDATKVIDINACVLRYLLWCRRGFHLCGI
jgi:hypothetical protein